MTRRDSTKLTTIQTFTIRVDGLDFMFGNLIGQH